MIRDNKKTTPIVASFRSIEKVLERIVKLCLENENLKRLLYYTVPSALAMKEVTQEQMLPLMGKSIRIVPKLTVENDINPYIVIAAERVTPNESQTTFKKIVISIDIICNFDNWVLDDFRLRPWAIAGELDAMLNSSFLAKRDLKFIDGKQLVLNEHLGGCTLKYMMETFYDDYS